MYICVYIYLGYPEGRLVGISFGVGCVFVQKMKPGDKETKAGRGLKRKREMLSTFGVKVIDWQVPYSFRYYGPFLLLGQKQKRTASLN